MKEYIERKATIDYLMTNMGWYDENGYSVDDYDEKYAVISDLISAVPTADVWEVVHCEDCAHAEESLVSGCVYCNEMERVRIKEGFCAWGEKMTECTK